MKLTTDNNREENSVNEVQDNTVYVVRLDHSLSSDLPDSVKGIFSKRSLAVKCKEEVKKAIKSFADCDVLIIPWPLDEMPTTAGRV